MSTPPQTQKQTRQMFEWQCGACSAKQLVEEPTVVVINHGAVSVMMIAHENRTRCPQCGRTYIPVINRVDFNLYNWQYIEVPDDVSKLITVPENTRIV